MATLTAKPYGTAVAPDSAAGGGDVLPCADNYTLVVNNTDASSHSFTLVTSVTVGGRAVADDTFVVAAGLQVAVRLTYAIYADGNGQTAISYTAATGMKVQVVAG
jgi:hypothetical protein